MNGYDRAQLVKGRKRHLLVDRWGWVMQALVTEADRQDRDAAQRLLVMIWGRFPRLPKLWADGADRGALLEWVRQFCRLDLEIVEPDPEAIGFQVLPRRWGWSAPLPG